MFGKYVIVTQKKKQKIINLLMQNPIIGGLRRAKEHLLVGLIKPNAMVGGGYFAMVGFWVLVSFWIHTYTHSRIIKFALCRSAVAARWREEE